MIPEYPLPTWGYRGVRTCNGELKWQPHNRLTGKKLPLQDTVEDAKKVVNRKNVELAQRRKF